MPNAAFPNSIYDQPRNLLAALGSWWATDYASGEQVAAIVDGRSHVERQTVLNLLDLMASMSRFSVPIYHTENWYPLYLRKSQCNMVTANIMQYDSGDTYDAGRQYDVPQAANLFTFPKPSDLVNVPLLLNRFVAPSYSQQQGMDYVLTADGIAFRDDPFADSRVAKRTIYDGGVAIDTEAVLWVFRGEFDWETAYQQFGYVIGMRMQSGPGYNMLMNAVYNGITGGMTTETLLLAMSAITGVPLVEEATETVVDIVETPEELVIITDLHVYKFAPTVLPIVTIGQVVKRGRPLTDALRVTEVNRGQVPGGLAALAIGPGLLASCFFGDLIFENRDVPLVVDTAHPSGYTYVSWGLGGFALDVQHFFDEMHTRGIAAATTPIDACADAATITYADSECTGADVVQRRGTLAHLLDSRPVAVGEPTADNLPATINPLRFLLENVLRNNTVIVQMKAAAAHENTLGLQHYQLLRKIIPPAVAVLLVVEITLPDDTLAATDIAETLTTFDGISPISDTVTFVTEDAVQVRQISGACQ